MTKRLRLTWKLWAISFALWTVYSVAYSGSVYLWYRSAGHTAQFTRSFFIIAMLNHWINAALTPLVLVIALRYPIRARNWYQALLGHLGGMSLFIAAHMGIRLLLYPVKDQFTGQVVAPSLALFRSMFLYGVHEDGLGAYVFVIILAQLLFLQNDTSAREVHAEHLRSRLAEARLEALKLQLKPHFLFNTLNAVSALVHEDPHAADDVVLKLSELLRFTIRSFDRNLISLAEELELLKIYIQIEEIRFGGRLSCNIDVEDAVLDAQVPCMMLQPIVENAVGHGIGKCAGPGRVEIRAWKKDESVMIEVKDDGPGLPPGFDASAAAGIGLRNTMERLHHLFPIGSEFSIQDHSEGGVAVVIKLPLLYSESNSSESTHEHAKSGDRRRRTAGAAETAPVGE